jgi:hypothetical protein
MNGGLRTRAPAAVILAGCFNPDYPEGRPCGFDDFCPPGQLCDLETCRADGTSKTEPPLEIEPTACEPVLATSAGLSLGEPTCFFLNDCLSGMGCPREPRQCRTYCDVANFPFSNDPSRCAPVETCESSPTSAWAYA